MTVMHKKILMVVAFLVLGALVGALTACQSQGEIDHASCVEFGYQPGTEGYGSCRLLQQQLALQRNAQLQAGFQGAANHMLLQQALQPPAPQVYILGRGR